MARFGRCSKIFALVLTLALAASSAHAADPPLFALKWSLQGVTNPSGKYAAGIDVDALGNVYVVNRGTAHVEKYDNNGNLQALFGASGSGNGQFLLPWGLGLDASGNIYVADTNNNRIQELDASGNFVMAFGSLGTGDGQLQAPTDVAVNSDGFIYVADQGNGRIEKFGASGQFLAQWNTLDGLLLGTIWAVATDSHGNVFIGDDANTRIVELDRYDAVVRSIPSIDFITGLSVGASGHILASSMGGGPVAAYTANGGVLYTFGSVGSGDGQFQSPFGVAEDVVGNIFVSDRTLNQVQKFVPAQATPAHTSSWGRVKTLFR